MDERDEARDREAPGVWLGVDVGTVRIGVARSDPRGILATPVTTLRRDTVTDSDIRGLVELVREHEAVGVVVGLPRTLAGREGRAARMARDYARILAESLDPVPVLLHDERYTTVTAQRRLAERGVRGSGARALVDQAAAVEILQHWLDGRAR